MIDGGLCFSKPEEGILVTAMKDKSFIKINFYDLGAHRLKQFAWTDSIPEEFLNSPLKIVSLNRSVVTFTSRDNARETILSAVKISESKVIGYFYCCCFYRCPNFSYFYTYKTLKLPFENSCQVLEAKFNPLSYIVIGN